MPDDRPDSPVNAPKPGPQTGGGDETTDQLASQARAANEQALQLAKLAEESARLAQHLNLQMLQRSGQPIPDLSARVEPPPSSPPAAPPPRRRRPQQDPAGASAPRDDDLPVIVTTDTLPRPSYRGRQRRRSRGRHTSRSNRHGDPQSGTALINTDYDETPAKESARTWASVLISMALHIALLLALALLTFVIKGDIPINTVIASFAEDDDPVEKPLPIEKPVDEPVEEIGKQEEQPQPEDPPPEPQEEQPPEEPPAEDAAPQEDPPVPPVPEKKLELAEELPPPPAPEAPAAEPDVDLAKVGSRSEQGKAVLLERYGGTAASESAVSRALDWFVSVQRPDGSWNFNDVGRCSHAGDTNNPMGATSYVLLAFLGSGHTHRQGKYKTNVTGGLNFLLKFARHVPAGTDLRGPNVDEHDNFYVQGAAAMALAEAYAMTKDRRLRSAAQGAVTFIVNAQDPLAGGWRYEPRSAGCTSVTTLQLTALVSARKAGLNVPAKVFDGISHYYTTVHCNDGPGRYCYRPAEPDYKSSSTSQATLGRMYLGVPKDDDDLQASVALLDRRGPYDNRYYCYYATQVMKNWGGPEWDRWNASMRDELIRTQSAAPGPELGSWTPLQRGVADVSGGRLFSTVLCCLTLEVYYRYLPIYDQPEEEMAASDEPAALDVGNE